MVAIGRTMPLRVDRQRVLAYRAAAQGLDRAAQDVGDLAVLDLGVQDTTSDSAAQALATRLAGQVDRPARQPELETTWSVRGAPHVHRAAELAELSRALWPWSDEDALARLDTSASPVRASGLPPRVALRLVAEQIADIVDRPMPKGEVSTALTPRISETMTVDCRSCEATHIVETLFRAAVLPAGMRFDPDGRVVTFVPLDDWPGVPQDAEGEERLITAYLRLHGPAGPGEVAHFLGTKASEVAARWPGGLVEVDVNGERRERWIPGDAVDLLAAPPEPPEVRLLPPSDPWLQARDREFVVPDEARRRALWPILGRPGAVLASGEIVGTWRARKRGRRLELTIQPFDDASLPSARTLDEEGAVLARARGLNDVDVTIA